MEVNGYIQSWNRSTSPQQLDPQNIPNDKLTIINYSFYALHYSDIIKKMDLFERKWDEKAQAPYLASASQNMLIALDDKESVRLKSEYIIKNNAAGILVRPLMGDYLEDSSNPLPDVIHKKLSAEEYYSMADYKSVKKFDSHIHINTEQTAFMDLAREDNFQFLDIVDDRPFGLPMDEQLKFAFMHLEKFADRMTLATTFKAEGWDNEDWVKKTIGALDKSFAKGAKAVKIWKNIGMDLRDEDGRFVMVDDSQLDPVLDYLAQNDITLVGHNGEPRDCWLPIEEMTFNQGYYGSHPEYHMYLHPEYPSYDDQINARDNMLAKHQDLKFIGAHMGSLEWSLDELAKRLDRFPNMRVDLSRMSNLQLHTLKDRQKTRDFFIKYQDRLIYATDTAINPVKDTAELKKNIHERWLREWQFYVTDAQITLKGHGKLKGLKLPRHIVDKIYWANAQTTLGIKS